MAEPAVLRCRGITKAFGGVTALRGVDFDVRTDETVGVIGPNGSGKTTLFNVLVGSVRPTAGEVHWRDERITGAPPHRIARAGVVRTFQGASVFPTFTARAAVEAAARGGADVDAVVDLVGLTAVANELSGALPYGHQKLLGVAMALASAPALLLMDEPAAGLNSREVRSFLDLIARIRRDLSIGVAIIDHDMTLIMPACDRVVVLDHGEVLAVGAPSDVQRDRRVLDSYLGRDVRTGT